MTEGTPPQIPVISVEEDGVVSAEGEHPPDWRRRLSQLFIPPKEAELEEVEKNDEDSSRLIEENNISKIINEEIPSVEKRRRVGVVDKTDVEEAALDTEESDDSEEEDFPFDRLSNLGPLEEREVRSNEKMSPSRGNPSSQPNFHTSLSSLLSGKEKNAKPSLTSKQSREILTMAILMVIFFSFSIAAIILVYYYYYQHILQLTIFGRIKFLEDPRVLHIYDDVTGSPNDISASPMMSARLGINLHEHSISKDCTKYLHYLKSKNRSIDSVDHVESYEDVVCRDWEQKARLQLRRKKLEDDVECYSVWWVALTKDLILKDCIMVDEGHGIWWGGGEMTEGGYPLTNAHVSMEVMRSGKLGPNPWGLVLRRAWLSSKYVLVALPENSTATVSVNHREDGLICFQAVKSEPITTLNYGFCTAKNLSSLLRYLQKTPDRKERLEGNSVIDHFNSITGATDRTADKALEDVAFRMGNLTRSSSVIERVLERILQPSWVPWLPSSEPHLTQDAVMSYVEKILALEYGLWGYILLPSSWEGMAGDLTFDPIRFPDPSGMISGLSRKGFRLALTLHPFVSVNGLAFQNGTQLGYWVKQKGSLLPAVVQNDESHTAAITDFSNPRAAEWYSNRVKVLKDKLRLDRFHLKPANVHTLPQYHEFHTQLPSLDSTHELFLEAVSRVSIPLSTEGAITPPPSPTFVTLGDVGGSWAGLETLIPRMLTLSLLGIAFQDAGVVGGEARAGHVPDRELYIRWLEVAAFLPVFQLSVLPSSYDIEVIRLAKEYWDIRRNVVLPRLRKAVPLSIHSGTPLITPLALFAPEDPVASAVPDQWVIGDDLLVAPVLSRGTRARNVYLPDGIWKDLIDGRLRRGNSWLRGYKVPLTQVPHFTRLPPEEFSF